MYRSCNTSHPKLPYKYLCSVLHVHDAGRTHIHFPVLLHLNTVAHILRFPINLRNLTFLLHETVSTSEKNIRACDIETLKQVDQGEEQNPAILKERSQTTCEVSAAIEN